MVKSVNVLGTEYAIELRKESEDIMLTKNDGYCDNTIPLIVVGDFEEEEGSLKNLEVYTKKVLRHEIIHAFLNESGLQCCSDWARNEEMVDFFAVQFHKIAKAFKEVDC